jgi:hypothetical protein
MHPAESRIRKGETLRKNRLCQSSHVRITVSQVKNKKEKMNIALFGCVRNQKGRLTSAAN